MTAATNSQVRTFKTIKPDFENHTTLINFLLTMSQTVQTQVEKAIEALLTRNEGLAGCGRIIRTPRKCAGSGHR
jgi:hypothetical protein